jgi:hypothetical protein
MYYCGALSSGVPVDPPRAPDRDDAGRSAVILWPLLLHRAGLLRWPPLLHRAGLPLCLLCRPRIALRCRRVIGRGPLVRGLEEPLVVEGRAHRYTRPDRGAGDMSVPVKKPTALTEHEHLVASDIETAGSVDAWRGWWIRAAAETSVGIGLRHVRARASPSAARSSLCDLITQLERACEATP